MEADKKRQQVESGFHNEQDDFLSLSEILGMILKHRKAIAILVILSTTFAAVFFTLAPRQFKAEGLLRVIPPDTLPNEKFDQAALETSVFSHLQSIQAAFIANEVARTINAQKSGSDAPSVTAVELQKRIKVARPPKSHLITIESVYPSQEMALAIVKTWIREYLSIVRRNNISIALSHVRFLLKKAQAEFVENQAKVEHLVSRAEQINALVNLSRGIKDSELWRELSDNASVDKLKNLSKIHISDQEQNEDYLVLKKALYEADQLFAASKANTEFLRDVASYLETKIGPEGQTSRSPLGISSNAADLAETLINITDIIEVGQPAPKNSSSGIARNTLIVFFASLIAASFASFLWEWLKTIET